MALKTGIPCHLYDIDDKEACEKADELVRKYGDWSEDYLIPQVFEEDQSGKIRHVFTGRSGNVELTRRGVDELLKSEIFRHTK